MYNRILSSQKKEGNSDICTDTDEHYAKLNKSAPKNTDTMVQFHSYQLLRVVKIVQTESRMVVPGL